MARLKIRKAGFSLIELMIVIGLISVLSAIGTTQYRKFLHKSRQTEAKAALSGIYVAEQSFFFEYNGYHAWLPAIGYGPGTRMAYNVGFSTDAGSIGPGQGYTATLPPAAIPPPIHFGLYCANSAAFPDVYKTCNIDFRHYNVGGFTNNPSAALAATQKGFVAGAARYEELTFVIDASQPNPLVPTAINPDYWTIDHTKTLRNSTTSFPSCIDTATGNLITNASTCPVAKPKACDETYLDESYGVCM